MMESIGGKLLDWGISKAADVLFDQTSAKVQERLNQDDVQGAIALGIQSAANSEKGLPPAETLFFSCDEIAIRKFKGALFSHADVLEELKRPFQNEGKPRLDYLLAAAKQVASEMGAKITDSALKRWLEAFSEAYFQKTSEIRFRIAREDYCTQLVQRYDDVKFAGIAIDGQVVEEQKELEKVFVMPDAVGEAKRNLGIAGKPVYTTQSGFEYLQSLLEEEIGTSRQQSLIEEQLQEVRAATSQWSGAKVLASKLLSQAESKKLVLLGAPGSGKTTLMSYFAVVLAKESLAMGEPIPPTPLRKGGEAMGGNSAFSEGEPIPPTPLEKGGRDNSPLSKGGEGGSKTWGLPADTLPILIRIRDLATNPEQGILDYLRRFAEESLTCEKLPGEFFETFLRDGKALILLDGLDEVANEGRRQEMVLKIEGFLGQYDQNRAIVTSRPAGYRRDFFRTSEYPHYLLQPFDDEKISTFIDHWYDSRVSDPAEADRRKASLQKALNEQDRIKQLARNPLLLTIIALIHRYQAQLPRERYKLYDKAVETLLTTWDANREITNHQTLQYLRLDDLRRLMERLAYWIHTQGGTGDDEGGTLIDKEELLTQLSRYIREMKKLERHEATAEADRFLRHIRERTGLLNEQGQDRYAFVHKTFQEYLAAQEIRD